MKGNSQTKNLMVQDACSIKSESSKGSLSKGKSTGKEFFTGKMELVLRESTKMT